MAFENFYPASCPRDPAGNDPPIYNRASSAGRFVPVGRVMFHRNFAADHVIACQLHMIVTDDTDGSHPAEVNSNCLNKVRQTHPGSIGGIYFWRVGITSPARIALGHRFHVTFWIDMRSSCCTYNTYNRASRVHGYSY